MVRIAHLGVAFELSLFVHFILSDMPYMFRKAFPILGCRGAVLYGMWVECLQHCALAETVAKQLLVCSRNLVLCEEQGSSPVCRLL